MLITLFSNLKFVTASIYHNHLIMSKEPILQRFGKCVQDRRKSLGLSQEQLADLAGVHRTYIGMIERAEKNITLLNIEKIAKALNVTVSDLFQSL